MFQSGATADNHRGCELWVDRHHPYAKGSSQSYFFHESHFHVMAYSDRYLFVHVNAPHLRLRLLIIHAPHEDATDCCPKTWWTQISVLMERHAPDLPLIILGDCNARLGTITSEAVSNHAKEVESTCGHLLHCFLLESSMWAPATFSDLHSGDSVTWISPLGQGYRLDYVLLPQAWHDFSIRSYVQTNIDLALARHDHFVSAIDISFASRHSTHHTTPRTRIDPSKCQHPEKRHPTCTSRSLGLVELACVQSCSHRHSGLHKALLGTSL